MSNKICDDPTYQNMVLQKSRFQLLNIPPQRYNNLANNPYTLNYPGTSRKFTKQDLDMRRKVEVLKYSANNSNTQTNRFTKAEIYAQVISGKYQQRTYSNSYITENTINNQLTTCPTIYTPTSACGVPGPVMYLYEDTNVPIYNYTTNIDSNYGILTQGINPYGTTWDYTKDFNKICDISNNNHFTSIITSLFIYYSDVSYKIFNITTPITLTFNGTKIYQSQSNVNILFHITSVSTNILYNNEIYTPSSLPSYTFPTSYININSTANDISGNCYLGLIEIKNIILPIQKGYIFDIQQVINCTVTLTNLALHNLKITFNPTNFTRSATNCTITGDITNPITPMTVTAI